MERFILNTKSKRILFCTGAGASAESGIPTFRDTNGLWKNYDPKYLASAEALSIDPVAVNHFYDSRRARLGEVEPNYFHYFITLMQDKFGEDRVGVITTNVDDLHERAETRNVHYLHGRLKEVVKNGHVINIGYREAQYDPEKDTMRPNVVMFGEGGYYKNDRMYNPYKDGSKVIASLTKDDLVFVVGCSNLIVNFPEDCFHNGNDCKVYIVNPNEFGESIMGDETIIRKKACDAVPEIEDIILEHLTSPPVGRGVVYSVAK